MPDLPISSNNLPGAEVPALQQGHLPVIENAAVIRNAEEFVARLLDFTSADAIYGSKVKDLFREITGSEFDVAPERTLVIKKLVGLLADAPRPLSEKEDRRECWEINGKPVRGGLWNVGPTLWDFCHNDASLLLNHPREVALAIGKNSLMMQRLIMLVEKIDLSEYSEPLLRNLPSQPLEYLQFFKASPELVFHSCIDILSDLPADEIDGPQHDRLTELTGCLMVKLECNNLSSATSRLLEVLSSQDPKQAYCVIKLLATVGDYFPEYDSFTQKLAQKLENQLLSMDAIQAGGGERAYCLALSAVGHSSQTIDAIKAAIINSNNPAELAHIALALQRVAKKAAHAASQTQDDAE